MIDFVKKNPYCFYRKTKSRINRKYFKKYGLPLLFSLGNNILNVASIKAVEQAFGNGENSNRDEVTNQAINNFQNDIIDNTDTILQEILKETLKQKTIITIKGGSYITVRPTLDIYFDEPIENQIYLKIEDTY